MSTSMAPTETSQASKGGQSSAQARPQKHLCNAEHLLGALTAGYAWLESQVPLVNSLNVFPVPDGDTGTNMALTMKAALDETRGRSFESVSELARVVAHGALMGARGNSGVILSQILRGVARGLDNLDVFDEENTASAFLEAATTAYKGVMKPVEGTILTVAREAAQAASSAVDQGADIKACLKAAYAEAQLSLARTPSLLPVLAEAGVVDAGGQGLTFLLEGIVRHLNGEVMQVAVETKTIFPEHTHVPDGQYNYDTQFIVQGSNLNVDALREHIASLGDSVLVVGDGQAVKVHVHSDDPGEVLSYGITQGQISAVIIENMQLQYEEYKAAHTVAEVARPAASAMSAMGQVGIVAVASGAGMARILESLGVGAVVPGGQTMNPSTQDLLQAVDSLAQQEIIILPNNSNIILTAEQAKALSARHVVVLPTRTVPQGIAALLAFNYQAQLEENVQAMAEASQRVQTIEITRAVRSAQLNGLQVNEGQVIGLLNDQLAAAGDETTQVVLSVCAHLDLAESEIITIYYGEVVKQAEADALADKLRSVFPAVETEVLDGGQAHYYYIISVE